jgi:hypothetical protein
MSQSSDVMDFNLSIFGIVPRGLSGSSQTRSASGVDLGCLDPGPASHSKPLSGRYSNKRRDISKCLADNKMGVTAKSYFGAVSDQDHHLSSSGRQIEDNACCHTCPNLPHCGNVCPSAACRRWKEGILARCRCYWQTG